MIERTEKRVVVTGGASGIGFDIAQKYLEIGAKVFVCDVQESAVSLLQNNSRNLRALQVDVVQHEQVEEFFKSAIEWMGGVDVLVNNVGIEGPHLSIEDLTYEDWNRQLQTNLSSMFYCAKQVIPNMKKRREGIIINLSTASVKTKPSRRAGYIISKSAVEELTRVLARELGPFNIRSNCIRPGLMNNPRMQGIIKRYAHEQNTTEKDILNGYLKYISMRSVIEMEEIGDLCVFLASNAARHITGQIISLDGNIEWEA